MGLSNFIYTSCNTKYTTYLDQMDLAFNILYKLLDLQTKIEKSILNNRVKKVIRVNFVAENIDEYENEEDSTYNDINNAKNSNKNDEDENYVDEGVDENEIEPETV